MINDRKYKARISGDKIFLDTLAKELKNRSLKYKRIKEKN